MLGKAQTAASAHPTTSSHIGCGSGALPLNSQTEQISAGFPPAGGNTSCIASGCSLALSQLQSPPLPGSQALMGCSHKGISPSGRGVLLNPAFHTELGHGHSAGLAMVTFTLMWAKAQGRRLIPCPHRGCSTSPKPLLQTLGLHPNGPKGPSLCTPPLVGAELALITILLIAPSSIALLLSTGNVWPQLSLKWGLCLEAW